MPDDRLTSAYLSAVYLIDKPACQLQVHAVTPLVLIKAFPELEHWAFITAYNPGSILTTKAENQHANAQLLAQLRALSLHILPGEGKSADNSWPSESSFFVFNLSKEKALNLARRFGQNAILYCSLPGDVELVWT